MIAQTDKENSFLQLVKARYSVRSYTDQPVEQVNWIISWSVCVWLPRL